MKKLVVLLDPGHGGPDDRGTQIPGGPCEAVWTLEQACLTRDAIKDLDLPITVELCRSMDVTQPFCTRNTIAMRYNAHLVVSLHINANPRKAAMTGLSCFLWPGSQALNAAQTVIDHCPSALVGSAWQIIEVEMARGHWTCDARAVVGAYRAPCLLVEHGFARTDAVALLCQLIRWSAARAVAQGVKAFYEEVHDG